MNLGGSSDLSVSTGPIVTSRVSPTELCRKGPRSGDDIPCRYYGLSQPVIALFQFDFIKPGDTKRDNCFLSNCNVHRILGKLFWYSFGNIFSHTIVYMIFIYGFWKLFVLFIFFGDLTESCFSKLCHLHVPTPYPFMTCGPLYPMR